ncbi:Nudix family hydrolase [Verticiella sediminum]|uniref:8-oxo-dGTP diphosphatase n=1 Tax=Verticiella sediminum TaxID=1247510 RepID=A0A556A7J4_9BURK|nr:Nudix family hydrolase [Verticiella sediminum]TSH88851.1 Nudix family hydrolase [Verticiella sediminum]
MSSEPNAAPKLVEVAAGLIIDREGRLLLGQRPQGKPYAGWWELPGGKLEPGEDALTALARELDEELGIQVTEATPWITHVHAYSHATVRLEFCRVTGWRGEPRGLENQRLAWVDPRQDIDVLQAGLGEGQLLPATLPPLAWMQVPDTLVIGGIGTPAGLAGHLARVERALRAGVRLFQFREPDWPEGPQAASLHAALQALLGVARAQGARVLVNSAHPLAWANEADGLHLRSADLALGRPEGLAAHAWLGASVHDADQIAQARALGARYAVLGPVLATPTHPQAEPLGWARFAALREHAGLPLFALGGQGLATRDEARRQGAHGIAGIRLLAELGG